MADLIDRGELRERIYSRFGRYSTKVIATVEEGRVMSDWAFLEPFLNAAPTIEPEVRHGRWFSLEGWFNKSIVKCSVCGNTLNMDGVNAGRGDANFCPNCGARMDATDTNVGGKGGADNG